MMPRLKGKKRGARLAVGPKVEVLVPVVRAHQSPLNESQWLVTLECGHERWVTSDKKPEATHCHACEAKGQGGGVGGGRRPQTTGGPSRPPDGGNDGGNS